MLQELRIKNLAVIEEAEISFNTGLNIISGETGAGKSVIFGALSLILGKRGSTEMIRTGAKEASIEARFTLPLGHIALTRLDQMGLSAETELIIKRVLTASGKSRVYVNGSMLNLEMLREIGSYLIDVYGQHDQQSLLDDEVHLEILDKFGHHEAYLARLAEHLDELREKRQKLRLIKSKIRERAEKEEFLKFQIQEIEQAHLLAGEDRELETEKQRLLHAEKLTSICELGLANLYNAEGSVTEQFHEVLRGLRKGAEIDPFFDESISHLENARLLVEEAAQALRIYQSRIYYDPARLEEIEDRLRLIGQLKRKHGDTIPAILEKELALQGELATIAGGDDLILELEAATEKLERDCLTLCEELANARRQVAQKLSQGIIAELAGLGMMRVRFFISQETRHREEDGAVDTGENGLIIRNYRVTSRGYERVRFFISPNPGEEPRPLSKIASGGELSRIMLAIKKILSEFGQAETLIFDEVDAGISGQTAYAVGKKIKEISGLFQTLCITHLPQIATFADAHVKVEKRISGERTQTAISLLDAETRIQELARMFGGDANNIATRNHVLEIIRHSQDTPASQ